MRLSEAHRRRPCSTFPEAEQAALEGTAARASHAASLAAPTLARMSAASFALGLSDPAVWQRTHASGQVCCLPSDCADLHTTCVYVPDPHSIAKSDIEQLRGNMVEKQVTAAGA